MRYLFGFMCVCALGLVPLVGCSDEATGDGGAGGMGGTGGAGGSVVETIEEMLVGRWWLDWDNAGGNPTPGAVGLLTFTDDGWANYDVQFASIPCYTDWFRLYTNWSLFDVVSETEFGYALTYTQGSCNREVGWTEEFKVVLDQLNPPKGEVTRLVFPEEGASGQWTMPIERCTTDINATEACNIDTGLGAPTQNPPTVELTLTLVVGAPGADDRPPLEGAAFCETDTENCEMTDANGQATIEVVVPADQQISYTVSKEGYLDVLYTDVVDDTLFTDRSHWTLTDAEMERLSDLLMTPYPYEGTGSLVVSVSLVGATFELVGASGKGFYFDALGEPSLDLDSTTIYGEGGFVEVAPVPDEVEVRLGGTATNCTPLSAWPGSEANTIKMLIMVGFLSWSSMSCDAL